MKSFRQYLSEELNYNELHHVMSGAMPDKSGTEHAYHTTIPSNRTKSGTTNVYLANVTSPNGTDHHFHFGINDDITPEILKKRHAQVSAERGRSVAPHEAFYSFGETEAEQRGVEHHGPETMLHVIHHFTNLGNSLPVGHRIHLDPGEVTEDMPDSVKKIRERKLRVYRKIAHRAERSGKVRIVSPENHPSIVLERI